MPVACEYFWIFAAGELGGFKTNARMLHAYDVVCVIDPPQSLLTHNSLLRVLLVLTERFLDFFDFSLGKFGFYSRLLGGKTDEIK